MMTIFFRMRMPESRELRLGTRKEAVCNKKESREGEKQLVQTRVLEQEGEDIILVWSHVILQHMRSEYTVQV